MRSARAMEARKRKMVKKTPVTLLRGGFRNPLDFGVIKRRTPTNAQSANVRFPCHPPKDINLCNRESNPYACGIEPLPVRRCALRILRVSMESVGGGDGLHRAGGFRSLDASHALIISLFQNPVKRFGKMFLNQKTHLFGGFGALVPQPEELILAIP